MHPAWPASAYQHTVQSVQSAHFTLMNTSNIHSNVEIEWLMQCLRPPPNPTPLSILRLQTTETAGSFRGGSLRRMPSSASSNFLSDAVIGSLPKGLSVSERNSILQSMPMSPAVNVLSSLPAVRPNCN